MPTQHTLGCCHFLESLMLTRETNITSVGSSNRPQPPTLNRNITSSKRPTLIASGVSLLSTPTMPWAPPTHWQTVFHSRLTAYSLIYFHELHEDLCTIHHGILHHPAHRLIQGNIHDMGGVIINIISRIIIIFPILQVRKPKAGEA